ncbi:hypothetical protein ACN9MF_02095 [Methylobacterium fujisawaense]|uniref:hypothetical protein n=1 Tax=Methylobacterium fujisawaense TaxID=107400 RepID=UPI003CF048AC
MNWDIRPTEGAGSLSLGMTIENVSKVLDLKYPVIERASNPADGSVTEYRGPSCAICHYREALLSGIDLRPSMVNVTFEGIDVFSMGSKALLALLEKSNGKEGFYGFGFIVFNKLSVSAKGFFDGKKFYDPTAIDREDERSLGVFDQCEFSEEILSILNPFKSKNFRESTHNRS